MIRGHEKSTKYYNESKCAVVTDMKHMENIITVLAKRGFWGEEVKTKEELSEDASRVKQIMEDLEHFSKVIIEIMLRTDQRATEGITIEKSIFISTVYGVV